MLTNKDINILKEIFVTKEDLRNELNKYATKDDLINFKDAILSEILAMRDELRVVIGYRDQIEDHEVRIEKIETKVRSN